jgi:ABC-type nitrate/sulfonate/bicarbonate transport system substrate-binding protein
MASPDVQSVQDLRGKPVSVGRVGQNDYFGWVWLAQKEGWSTSDFTFLTANDQNGQLGMLASGVAVGTVVAPPNEVIAQRQGAHLVIDSEPDQIQLQQVGLVLGHGWLNQNRETALNVMKACVAAAYRWKTDRPFTEGVISKWLQTDDQDVIDSAYTYMSGALPQVPYPSRDGFVEQIKEVGTLTPDALNVNPDACFDNSLIQELDSSGFINQIYGA